MRNEDTDMNPLSRRIAEDMKASPRGGQPMVVHLSSSMLSPDMMSLEDLLSDPIKCGYLLAFSKSEFNAVSQETAFLLFLP